MSAIHRSANSARKRTPGSTFMIELVEEKRGEREPEHGEKHRGIAACVACAT